MKNTASLLAVTGWLLFMSTPLSAEAVKDREGAVRKDKATMENDARWIYNDVQRGFDEAKRTGKPLLVVLRCIPCLACMGLDASVLTEAELQAVLDKFVCVRVINANDLDLSKFQFDYDLSFSTMFFHPDGTVLGRYGSWTHQKDAQDASTLGYRRTLEAVLALHQGYSANKESLSGKQGGPAKFKTPVDIPFLAGKYKRELDWEGKIVGSCVHCHQVGDAFRATYREQKQAIPAQWIYPMPAPDTVGMVMAPDDVAKVKEVLPGSAAAKAGVSAGDVIASIEGQPVVSIADMAWALHNGPESGSLGVMVRKGGAGEPAAMKLELAPNWRTKSDISRRVATWPMRGMAFGGMVLEDLPDEERTARGLSKDQLALRAKGVGQYGKHATAKNNGFQKEDVIVSFAGVEERMTEGEIIGYLLTNHFPGEKVSVTVLRGSEKKELKLPMQ
ncbi:PDZ domain-containing protein [Roseimicrobium gellanilyticum]|uniref:PDZ domain-containing protein n=1 Tax=Roseimicrobium gellanilyticum TaxID=748857 RepID=A0A366HNB2_9BACT|nr:Trx7/PDZ domain-containing (seleno)protein [Roseimicrobium gellanilyticum]RBP44648.1 PDZ domain-containing protein [Roseimicrobium gellanilyticum]